MLTRVSAKKLMLFALIAMGLLFQPTLSAYATCPEGMVAYWHLDDTPGAPGGTYEDAFLNADGVGGANPTAVDGVVGGAQEFSLAAGTKINVLQGLRFFDWAADESFSIELWVKTPVIADPDTSLTGNQILIGRSDGSLAWWINIHGAIDNKGKVQFVLNDSNGGGDGVNIRGGADDKVLTDGEWHHIAVVRNTELGTITVYVDGATNANLTATDTTNADFVSTNGEEINIGWLDQGAGYHLDGALDEIAIYSTALSDADILAHYNNGAGMEYCSGVAPYVPYPDNTLSHWNLDEDDQTAGAAGGTYADSYADNDGTGVVNPTVVAGVVGNAQEFSSAAGTKINVLKGLRFFDWAADESFSIELWVKTPVIADPDTSLTGNQMLISRSDGSLAWWINIHGAIDNKGKVQFVLNDSNGGGDGVNIRGGADDKVLTDGEWHHIAVVRNTELGTITVYVDGATNDTTLTATDTTNEDFVSTNGEEINIGWLDQGAGYHLDGALDEIAIYNRALSGDEIITHYNAGEDDDVGIDGLRPEPVADAGANQTVKEGTSPVTLDGSASADAYGGIVTWLWEQTDSSGYTVALSGADTDTATFTAPDVDTAGATLVFQLTVTDADGQQSTTSTNVTVTSFAPVAEAGDDQTVTEGADVTLTGTATDDDSTVFSYLWEQTSGTSAALTNANTAIATFTAPTVDADEALTFQLTVTDDDGNVNSDTVQVTVQNSSSPSTTDSGGGGGGGCFITTALE